MAKAPAPVLRKTGDQLKTDVQNAEKNLARVRSRGSTEKEIKKAEKELSDAQSALNEVGGHEAVNEAFKDVQ